MQLFTLKNFKFIINQISDILQIEDQEEKYNQLIGYNNERRLMALYVLYYLGENKEKYDNLINFDENLKRLFNVKDKILLDKMFYQDMQELYMNKTFFKNVCLGIEIFNNAYQKEVI
jgi:hypothetical protein